MSILSPNPDPPRVRVTDVHLGASELDRSPAFYRHVVPSKAVAGGRAVRLGAVFMREGDYRRDLAMSRPRHERATRSRGHKGGSQVTVAYPDAAALARVTQCLADALPDPGPSPVVAGSGIFRARGSFWELGFGGTVVHLPELKGLVDIAALLANPGKEIHSLDLSGGPASGLRDDSMAAALDGVEGDLGDVIDARARAAYRERTDELLAEIEEGRLARDPTRAERAQVELAAIREQLEAAYGLGGRVRRSGDPAERARSAVTARIRSAFRRLDSAHPALARHLRNAIRTGTWCVYAPETPTAWQL